jgi:hypothetical protein
LLSAKTGKVVTEKLGYTNAVFEPREFEQLQEIAIVPLAIAELFLTKRK